MQPYRQAISVVRERSKYDCVMQCIEKESQGFECVQPITYKPEGYYEAVYRMRSNDES